MPVAILIAAIAAYLIILVIAPGLRRQGLLFGAAVGLLLGAYFWFNSPESDQRQTRIAAGELEFDQIEIIPGRNGATLSGRVNNTSPEWRLREMTLVMRLHDCGTETTPLEECLIIGETRTIVRPDTPAGQLRGFSARFLFSDVPSLDGMLRLDWTVTDTRATR